MTSNPNQPHVPDPVPESVNPLPHQSPAYEFRSLSQGQPEVLITHDGHIYRLRATRNGKLILNK